MIHFFNVVLEGFNQTLCSRCEQDLMADPTVNIIFVGPAHGSVIRCMVCGVSPADTEEVSQNPREEIETTAE